MATREIEVDFDRAYYLAPGFLLSISGAGIAVFPQLTGQNVRRAQRGTIPFVATLSRQEARSLNWIIDELVARVGADRATLVQFVEALARSGALLTERPRTRFAALTPKSSDAPVVAPDALLTIVRPSTLVVDDGMFLLFDHGGTLRMRSDVASINAAIAFGTPRSVTDAWQVHRNSSIRLAEDAFAEFVKDAFAAGLLRVVTERDLVEATPKGPLLSASPRTVVEEQVARVVERHDREEAQRPGHRTPVVPVNADANVAPLSLALLVAHASEHDGGRLKDKYNFVPEFLTDEERLLARAHEPSIFLFSNYLWNMERNLALSKLVKHTNPNSITIHGGPNTPKYEADAEQFFAEHDHVDVAVHGEGEATFTELLAALDGNLETAAPLEILHDVAGLTFRSAAGGVARTGGRERIADLDTIPSPYLLGLLDSFGAAHAGAIIETNRGCPYGCTFCDWGSATLSRIRKFSLERVFGELEWSARHEIEIASIADANFGIMERDVEIAQKIADLKRQYGYPRTVATNYAKNTVKWLRQIIEIFADVEILTEGVVSLQSMDEPTLKIIRRSNIKLEKYNELSAEFRRARLPLAADIMMGLPGSTPASFRNDLQQCTNRDVRVRANPTQLLPNSPMNEPEYRQQYGIVAKPGEVVMESSTFTRAEWEEMNGLRRAYYIFDNWGVLRYVARFVRQETGVHEVDFYDRVRTDAADRTKWPIVATTLDILEGYMAPPGSWGLFVEEIGRYLTTCLGIADDSALRTVLDVQLAHLPAPARRFPFTISLAHDFAAWQDALLAARESAHRDDWELVVPRLSTYGPATLTVADPNDICSTDIGKPMGYLGLSLRSWELESPVARPRLGAATSIAS